jgi:tetratricopeptide (TPR) repeat protein
MMLFWSCATRRIDVSGKTKIGSEIVKSEIEIKKGDSPTVYSPYLRVSIREKGLRKDIYEHTSTYKRTLSTFGKIGLYGSSVALISAGIYHYATGYVVLGRDMIVVSIVPYGLARFLIPKKWSQVEKTDTIVEYNVPLSSEPVKIDAKDVGYSETLTSDGNGIVSVDLRNFLEKRLKKPLVFSVAPEAEPASAKEFAVSAEFFAELSEHEREQEIQSRIRTCLDSAEEAISSLELDEALSLVKKALSLDRDDEEAKQMLKRVEKYKAGDLSDFKPVGWEGHYRIALLYYKLGKQKQARRHIEEMWDEAPRWDIEIPPGGTGGFRQMVYKIKKEKYNKWLAWKNKKEKYINYILRWNTNFERRRAKIKSAYIARIPMDEWEMDIATDDLMVLMAAFGEPTAWEIVRASSEREAIEILISAIGSYIDPREESMLKEFDSTLMFYRVVAEAIDALY